MANKFSVNTLLLNRNTVTTTGNLIYVNGLLVGSGTYYPIGNPNNYSNSGNVESTGTALQAQITNALSTKVTGASITGGVSITGALNINAGANVTLTQAGTNSFSIISNVPNGLLSTGSHSLINSITGVSISGGLGITGTFNINAGSNITLTQQGSNTLSIASAAGGGSSTNGVTGINVTGVTISGAIRFLAGDGIEIIQSSNIITISTPIAETGASVLNGQLLIGTSGENSYIQGDLYASTGMYVISGSGSLGIASTLNLNGFISSGNVDTKLNGLALSGNFVSGISITGGLGIRNAFNINAGSNITLTQQGSNTLSISSASAESSSTNGVTGLSISGGIAISGAISINAGSNVTLTQAGTNSFSIISNVPNGLLSTGSHSLINSITGVSVSGGIAMTGAFNINAGSNITLTQAGNNSLSISSAVGGGTTINNAVTGFGIENYIPKFITSQSGISNSIIYELNNNIGIRNTNPTSTLDITGNIIASGIQLRSREWSNLTWNTGTVWNADGYSYEDRKILVITGNTTLQINNLYNGWSSLLQTIQSGVLQSSGGYSLKLPTSTKVANGGSGIVNLTSGEGSIDLLGFVYDGSKLFCSIGNYYN